MNNPIKSATQQLEQYGVVGSDVVEALIEYAEELERECKDSEDD